MAEYIERESAMLQIDAADFVRDDNFEGGATLLFCDDVVDRLSAIPAADVRPVVLCRDCKNADFSGMGKGGVWCNEMERAVSEDGWCYRGADMREEQT